MVKCEKPEVGVHKASNEKVIENEFYRISASKDGIKSIIDIKDHYELIDTSCRHKFGEVITRYASEIKEVSSRVESIEVNRGAVCECMELCLKHPDLPRIKLAIRLWKNVDDIDVSLRVLHDSKPLQTVFVAFPWKGNGIRYQAVLNDLDPVSDFMPGSQSDYLAVANWVLAKGSNILMNSMDSAVFSLSELHTGYVSPAHICRMKYEKHKPLTEEDYKKGLMYSILASNNFGTNFMCNQVFDGLYRYHIKREKSGDDSKRATWGEAMSLGRLAMITDRSRGELEPSGNILYTGERHCIALKKAEDCEKLVIRLWNHSDNITVPDVELFGEKCELIPTDALENADNTAREIPPKSIKTYLIQYFKRFLPYSALSFSPQALYICSPISQ